MISAPRNSLAALLAAAAALLLGVPAGAQAPPQIDAEAIKQIQDVVRWSGIIWSAVITAAAWALLKVVHRFVEQLGQRFARWRLWLQKLETVFQFFVYVAVGVVCFMLSFKLDDRVLALIGGTLAVSVGFATKDLIASVVAGMVIMIDRPFHVGDRIKFEGEYGDVISVGLRSVRIRTLDDNVVTVPNSKFLSEVVSSGNYGALEMQLVLDFLIDLDQDPDRARRIVHDAAISSRFVYLPRPVVVHVARVVQDNYMGTRLRLKAYVLDTRHEMAFQTDVTLRVTRAFREQNIRVPSLRVGSGSDRPD